jgi:hypothetical protein
VYGRESAFLKILRVVKDVAEDPSQGLVYRGGIILKESIPEVVYR